MDDSSPDKCGEICDKYKVLDNRVKVIHKENGGPALARNAGISIATGEYVTFVDPDDYLADDYFEVLESLLREDFDEIVFGYKILDYCDRSVIDCLINNDVVNRYKDGYDAEKCFLSYICLYNVEQI